MTKELIQELFYYDNGFLFNKVKRSSNAMPNTMAGTLPNNSEYRRVSISNKVYLEHRIIWIYFNGLIPKGMFIDHINQNKKDNKIENLRLCTRSQNQYNRGAYKNNTSGYKGVSFNKSLQKYSAQMRVNDVKKHLGYFDTVELAKQAYDLKAIEIQKEFATK
jgi:hypothetical protein